MENLEAHYSARDIETRILAALRAAGLNSEQRLSPVKLGALDHFHTGGLQASLRLQELAQIRAEDRVLDIGAGLAGPARMLAASPGCRVDCIDLSPDFCAGATLRFDPKTEQFTVIKSTSRNASVRQILSRPGEVSWPESGADKLVVIRE